MHKQKRHIRFYSGRSYETIGCGLRILNLLVRITAQKNHQDVVAANEAASKKRERANERRSERASIRETGASETGPRTAADVRPATIRVLLYYT